MAESITFHLMGEFHVESGKLLFFSKDFQNRKSLSLFKYLLLQPGYRAHKDELLVSLWAGLDNFNASAQLYKCVHFLRKSLQKISPEMRQMEVLRYDAEMLSLNFPYPVITDVEQFSKAFTSAIEKGDPAELQRLEAAWHGDLLPSDYQEPWTQPLRNRLRENYQDALQMLGKHYLEAGKSPEALDTFRKILRMDVLNEKANLGLIRTYATQGSRVQAIHHFRQYSKELEKQTGLSPSTEAMALFEAISSERLQSMEGTVQIPRPGWESNIPLAGRNQELAWFQAFLEKTKSGKGQAVLMSGPSGIGKSALLDEVLKRARANFFRIFSATLADEAKERPYSAFSQLFFQVEEVFPREEEPPADKVAGQYYLFDKAWDFLQQAARLQPLLIAIDNLHTANESELRLFGFIAEKLQSAPVMLVGVFRNDVRLPSQVQALQEDLPHITLTDLDRDGHHALLQNVMGKGALSQKLSDKIFSFTEGHPLFAKAVMEDLIQGGKLLVKEGVFYENPARPVSLPPSLAFLAVKRLEKSSPLALKILHLLATAGTWIHIATIESLLRLPRAAFLGYLDELMENNLLKVAGLHYAISHPLFGSAIYELLAIGERKKIHGDLAEALSNPPPEIQPPSQETIAWHYRQAMNTGAAVACLLQAASDAETKYAHQDAIRLYSQALELLEKGEDPDRQASVLEALADAHKSTGDVKGALEKYRQALDLYQMHPEKAPAESIRQLKRKIALAAILVQDMQTAGQILDELQNDVPTGHLEEAGYHIIRSLFLWHYNELEQAIVEGRQALDIAELHKADREVSQACEMLALAHFPLGRWKEGMLYEQKRHLAGWSPDIVVATDAHLCLWEYHITGEEPFEQATRFINEVSGQASQLGDLRCVAVCHYALGSIGFLRADFEAAEHHLEKARLLHYRIKSPIGEAYALARLGQLQTLAGQIDKGWTTVQEGLNSAEKGSVNDHALLRLYAVALQNRLAAGDLRNGAYIIAQMEKLETRGSFCPTCSVPLYFQAALFFAHQKDFHQAYQFCEKARPFIEMTGSPAATAHLQLTLGMIKQEEGLREESESLINQAKKTFLELGHKIMA